MMGMKLKPLLFVILVAGMLAGAAQAGVNYAGTTNASSGSGGSGYATAYTVIPPKVVNASNASIVMAQNFIIGKVGSQYFRNYMHLQQAQTYLYPNGTNYTYTFYTYNVPFSNGTTATGFFQVGGLVARTGVFVIIQNGSVTNYFGPSKNYTILISPQQAMASARAYGVKNVSGASMTIAYNVSQSLSRSTTGYRVAWAVMSGNRLIVLCPCPQPNKSTSGIACPQCATSLLYGVYVDITTGKVLGQYTINPAILTVQSGSSSSAGTLGDFTIFNQSNITAASITTIPSTPNPIGGALTPNVGALEIAAAVGIVIVLLYFFLRKK